MTSLHRLERLTRRGLVELMSARTSRKGFAAGGGAVGALILGAGALGALAIGAVAVGRMAVGDVRIEHLSVGRLDIERQIGGKRKRK